ncbi:hypothetical protein ACIPY6_28640 [Streptomyces sp. NPDC090054]|uniref:hypothetical protein n=1 Tax=Streptomyces sp. NPDC090054 TaxID=3365933 RepID=UPI00381BE586
MALWDLFKTQRPAWYYNSLSAERYEQARRHRRKGRDSQADWHGAKAKEARDKANLIKTRRRNAWLGLDR